MTTSYIKTCGKCHKAQTNEDVYALLPRNDEVTCKDCLPLPWVITYIHLSRKRGTYVSPAFKSQGIKFQILDDDGEVYFTGYAFEETFAPLDWAQPRYGATEIKYLTKGRWVTL